MTLREGRGLRPICFMYIHVNSLAARARLSVTQRAATLDRN
jgi:hypothetical protein